VTGATQDRARSRSHSPRRAPCSPQRLAGMQSNARGRYEKSQALLRRAQSLIPGGFHLSGRPLLDPAAAPLYMERGRGCRVWDADGNEYIDFVMAFGPFLLGYAHPEVDRAATRQLARGSLLSMNHPMHLSFIERVIARFPGAEMGAF